MKSCKKAGHTGIFLLILCLVFTMATPALAQDEATFTVSEVSAAPGQTAELVVTASGISEMVAFAAVLTFDNTVLSLAEGGVVVGNEVKDRFTVTTNADVQQDGTVGIAGYSLNRYQPEGGTVELCRIRFQVSNQAPSGRIPVVFENGSLSAFVDGDAQDVPVRLQEGAVVVQGSGTPPVVTDAPTPSPTDDPVTPTPTPSGGEPVIPPAPFDDLSDAPWAEEYVNKLAYLGVVSGTGAGKFEPNRSITREEFTKLIVSALSLEDTQATCEFTDVPQGEWYYLYVASAQKHGIINGMGDGSFGVGQTITRQDMATIAYRAAQTAGLSLPEPGEPGVFADEGEIAPYAVDCVRSLVRAGVISGMSESTFAPTGLATRAQAAKIICTLFFS